MEVRGLVQYMVSVLTNVFRTARGEGLLTKYNYHNNPTYGAFAWHAVVRHWKMNLYTGAVYYRHFVTGKDTNALEDNRPPKYKLADPAISCNNRQRQIKRASLTTLDTLAQVDRSENYSSDLDEDEDSTSS
jgi:hypothetical protein